jgi:hypothetical protein
MIFCGFRVCFAVGKPQGLDQEVEHDVRPSGTGSAAISKPW